MQRSIYVCATNFVFLRKQLCLSCAPEKTPFTVWCAFFMWFTFYIIATFNCLARGGPYYSGANDQNGASVWVVEKRRFVRKRIQLPKTTMGSPDNAIGPNTPEANRTSTPPKNLLYTYSYYGRNSIARFRLASPHQSSYLYNIYINIFYGCTYIITYTSYIRMYIGSVNIRPSTDGDQDREE